MADVTETVRPAALILAGGASKRMGRDKAALEWDGEPLLERIARITSESCGPIYVVAPEDSAASRLRGTGPTPAIWITDEQPGMGPLAGLAGGLAAADADGAELAFVCATDMPLIGAGLIDELLVALGESDDAAIAVDEQRSHPLAGVYRTRCAGQLRELVAAGERRMLAAVDVLRTHRVTVSDPDWLTNINAPEDLHRLRAS